MLVVHVVDYTLCFYKKFKTSKYQFQNNSKKGYRLQTHFPFPRPGLRLLFKKKLGDMDAGTID
jgi:hypothetical protein